jgi:ribonuclease HI
LRAHRIRLVEVRTGETTAEFNRLQQPGAAVGVRPSPQRWKHDVPGVGRPSIAAARARRDVARATNEAIDHVLLRAALVDRQRALELTRREEPASVADRVRRRASRLAKIHGSRRSQILSAADALILALYHYAAPEGWLCGWCDASVARDGSPRRVGVGAIVLEESGRELARVSRPIAECEPFEAEIAALEAALEAISTVAARRVRVYTDCDALVSLWLQRRQDPRLRRVRYLARRLRRFELRSLPRRHNQVVHRLARAGASRLNLHDS